MVSQRGWTYIHVIAILRVGLAKAVVQMICTAISTDSELSYDFRGEKKLSVSNVYAGNLFVIESHTVFP